METITLEVDEATAQAYRDATPEQRARAHRLFHLGLVRRPADDEHTVVEVAEDIGRMTGSHKVTEEILRDILRGKVP